jgi:hypothetical protein
MENPSGTFSMRGARGPDGSLAGIAVSGTSGTGEMSGGGTTRGWVAEVLAGSARVWTALMLDAVEQLVLHGCDEIVAWFKDPRPWVPRACLAAGFVPGGHATGAVYVDFDGEAGDAPRKLGSWHLSAGDTDLI